VESVERLPRNVRISSKLPTDSTSFDVSQVEVVEALQAAEDRHFWFLARKQFIRRRLKRLGVGPGAAVVDLGCGSGDVAADLSRAGYQVTGVDGHLPLIERAAARAPNASFLVHDLASGPPPLPASFDVAAFFDVLEHLDDPAHALVNAMSMIRNGGYVVGTVPALMSLWSDIDVVSGHRLRYERLDLVELLGHVRNASVVEIVDFNRLLVPFTWMTRREHRNGSRRGDDKVLVDSMAAPPDVVNRMALGALQVEYALSDLGLRLPTPGASLWFAAKKIDGNVTPAGT
jgi:SAM-dependent methyltransferase